MNMVVRQSRDAQKLSAALPPQPPRFRAFTLVELLVVIGIIAILASLLLPALSKTKSQARTIDCVDHLHQLQLCWHMYTHDDEGKLPANNFVYYVSMGTTIAPFLGDNDISWCRSVAPFDPNPISDTNSLLYYYNQNPAIYHCPADTSTVKDYPGLLRNRSYNMSNAIDCTNDNFFAKETDIPIPSKLFVFIDTDADEITDPTFGVMPIGSFFQNWWLDIPASRHNSTSCNLSFADGHVETWKWKAPKGGRSAGTPAISDDDLDDLRRIQDCIKGAGGN